MLDKYDLGFMPITDLDQSWQPPSLIRVLLFAKWVARGLSFLHVDSEGCVDAEADLSLCWIQSPSCWFYHVAAQFCTYHVVFKFS